MRAGTGMGMGMSMCAGRLGGLLVGCLCRPNIGWLHGLGRALVDPWRAAAPGHAPSGPALQGHIKLLSTLRREQAHPCVHVNTCPLPKQAVFAVSGLLPFAPHRIMPTESSAASLAYHEPSIVVILVQASFLLLLSIANAALDRTLCCGLLGQVLVGIAWGAPGARWLSASAQETIAQLGYLGLILLVYEGEQACFWSFSCFTSKQQRQTSARIARGKLD